MEGLETEVVRGKREITIKCIKDIALIPDFNYIS